jgi:hypothetical protein
MPRRPKGEKLLLVPILDGLAAHGAFKAADFARLYDMLAAVINRAAFAGPMTEFWHTRNMRCGLSVFQLTILS